MVRVMLFLEPERGSFLRERPVEEVKEIAVSTFRVSYTVYNEEGLKVSEGVEDGVMEVEARGATRITPGLTSIVVLAVDAAKGAISRKGRLLIVE